jgi:hypothetical protein
MNLRYTLLLLIVCSLAELPTAVGQNGQSEVIVLSGQDYVPTEAVRIKALNILDYGFKMQCGFNEVMQDGIDRTRKAGGNVLKITEWLTPDAISTCYRLRGEIYHVDDFEALKAYYKAINDSVIRTLVPDTAHYAVLYLYSPLTAKSSFLKYSVYVRDVPIWKFRWEKYLAVRIYKEGKTDIWTHTERGSSVPVDIRFGKAYFLKCSVNGSGFVGSGAIRLVEPRTGVKQFRFDKMATMELNGDSISSREKDGE